MSLEGILALTALLVIIVFFAARASILSLVSFINTLQEKTKQYLQDHPLEMAAPDVLTFKQKGHEHFVLYYALIAMLIATYSLGSAREWLLPAAILPVLFAHLASAHLYRRFPCSTLWIHRDVSPVLYFSGVFAAYLYLILYLVLLAAIGAPWAL